MVKERLDLLLVERRLVESRAKAQWLISNGFVLVNGVEIRKSGKRIDNAFDIQLIKEFPYVGRGGLKLEAALKTFSISVKNKICADIGASVGGFTDCLLKHGAFKVYAIDTATDLLHPSLRCEKVKDKVIPLLGVDARKLKALKEKVDICTLDVTFTSLTAIFPNLKNFLNKEGDIIALVKPLFETEFYDEKKFNIIQGPEKLKKILKDLISWCIKNGFFPKAIMRSPILGKGGSIEFLIHFKINNGDSDEDFSKEIEKSI